MDEPSNSSGLKYSLRPGRPADYAFAETLYLESMKPLLLALDAWNQTVAVEKFKGHFRLGEVEIIMIGGNDVGWIQIAEHPMKLEIVQLHLKEAYRTKGIGTQIVGRLQERARKEGKPICLEVVHGNPAVTLYQRLGFKTETETETKMQMRWDGP